MPTVLEQPLTISEPDVSGPLCVYPVFGPPPVLEYVSFAEAAAAGAVVKELPGGAAVNDLLVVNPLPVPVLLYEGEELRGAQQDRTVDAAVLVPAGATLQVAVSCVEHGRWDGSRHGEAFSASDRAAFPALRAAKSRVMRSRLEAGMPARADQHEVWEAVAAKSSELAAPSATGAMGDAFSHREDEVSALRDAIVRRDGQIGSLVAIGGRFVVLDMVSRADAFAALHGPLVSGYALDALGAACAPSPTMADAQALVAGITAAPFRSAPSTGLGETIHFPGGTGLRVDGELIQLSAFVDEPHRARRIRRPSSRA